MLARPVSLIFLLAGDADGDPSIDRQTFELDLKSFTVLMRPYTADASPDALLAFAVSHLVGEVAWGFG